MRGELRFRPTPIGETSLVAGRRYRLDPSGDERPPVALTERRVVGGRTVVGLAGIATPEAAAAFVGETLYVERAEVVLADGDYLDDDLVGCRLVDPLGHVLGSVESVEHYPAQDCLVLAAGRGRVPLVRAFIRRIDVGRGTIVVDLPEGLLEPSG